MTMINAYISQITPDDHLSRYQKVLNEMSDQRKARAMKLVRTEDKIRMLKAEWLVKFAITEIFAFKFSETMIENDRYGKPFCIDCKDLHLSLAHAGQYVVCALAPLPVGIDIERIRPIDFAVARRFFSRPEQNYIFSSPESEQLKRFYEIWTLKESYIKALGQGLSKSLNSFSVTPTDNKIQLTDDNSERFYFYRYALPHPYQMAVCSLMDDFPKTPQWRDFSGD